MKNKFVLVICILVLFIPTVAAFFVYNPQVDNLASVPDSVTQCLIADKDGNTFTVKEKADIDVLTTLLRGDAVADVPKQVLEYKDLTVTLYSGEQTDTYSVYASSEHTDSVYYKNSDGKYYKANSAAVESFLSSNYCISLYSVTPPVLSIGSTVITPKSMTWSYEQANGEYRVYPVQTTEDIVDVGLCEQDLGISFSQAPDSELSLITVYEGESEYKKEVYSDFDGVDTKEEKKYTVSLSAVWANGKAEYVFSATVKANPVFNIWTTSSEYSGMLYTEQGGLIVLGAKNADIAKLSCEVSPDPLTADFTPVFYQDGDTAYALVPVTYDTEPGSYNVAVKYGEASHTFAVEIREKDTNGKIYDEIGEEDAEELFSDANINALKTLISDVALLETSNAYLGTEEFDFPGDVSRHKTGYATPMYIQSIDKEFPHCGVDFPISKGDEATAMTDGTVVYVGENTILGGIVVIDHGLGMRSWYCRIDTDGIEVGTQVKAGDKVGEVDESGFGDDDRLHVSVTVGNQFISARWLIDQGIAFPEM